MSHRLDYYFRQRVSEAELDLGFSQLEQADRDMAADLGFTGVIANAVVSQHAPVPDLTVVELTEVLCARFGIPRELPVGAGGDVLRTLAPSSFRGVCGHYHVSASKPDPGLTLWPGLQAAFRESPPTHEASRREAGA